MEILMILAVKNNNIFQKIFYSNKRNNKIKC